MDDYDPTVEDQQDDILDALAMALQLAGPMLQNMYTIEGEATEIDEAEYEMLTYSGGAP